MLWYAKSSYLLASHAAQVCPEPTGFVSNASQDQYVSFQTAIKDACSPTLLSASLLHLLLSQNLTPVAPQWPPVSATLHVTHFILSLKGPRGAAFWGANGLLSVTYTCSWCGRVTQGIEANTQQGASQPRHTTTPQPAGFSRLETLGVLRWVSLRVGRTSRLRGVQGASELACSMRRGARQSIRSCGARWRGPAVL